MSEIEVLHNRAMDTAEEAFIAKRRGDTERSKALSLKALDLELQAASFFSAEKDSEPTRSILYRSAAALAYHAREYEHAEQLVAKGLSGFPPFEIKEELRALQDNINFHHHMALKGGELANNEMQMMLWGNATGYGIIPVDLLVTRIEQITKIFYRTVERLTNQPYRTVGGPTKETRDTYGLYLNGFAPGSFEVSFSIGEPTKQLPLLPDQVPEKIEPKEIIEEVISCFELLQEDELQNLQERFNNDDYYQNFVGVARQMAPDGDSIKIIGLASLQNGSERTVGLTRRKKEIPTPSQLAVSAGDKKDEARTVIQLTGMLKLADNIRTTGEYGTVTIIDSNNKRVPVLVPVTQMQDVVQPFFDENVTITGYKIGRRIYFEDIETAKEVAEKAYEDKNAPSSKQGSLFD
jgi:DNA-binding phage protein